MPLLTAPQRFWRKVDKTNDCWLWTASVLTNRGGYGQFNAGNGRIVKAHRFSWELANGPIPPGMQVDHRATCPKRCVNPAHLRLVTQKQNNENRPGAQRNSRSGIRGVRRVHNKWSAKVTHNRKCIHLGYFDTAEEAGEAARLKRLELFTHNDMDRA